MTISEEEERAGKVQSLTKENVVAFKNGKYNATLQILDHFPLP
jgi:hypothetical protein